jgi:capsular exopolysaccharide synthesis family protein
MPSAAAGASQLTGADVWRIIRSHMWLIIILLVASGVGGYLLNSFLLSRWPKFTATGYVQLQTQFMVDPVRKQTSTMDNSQLQFELRTQAQLLKTERLVSALLQKPDGKFRETTWFKGYLSTDASGATQVDTQRAKQDLLDEYRAVPVPDSKLIAISFTARNPKDAKDIVEEMVDMHFVHQKMMVEAVQLEQTQVLESLRASYGRKLMELRNAILDLQRRLADRGVLRSASGNKDVLETELQELIETFSRLQANATQAQTMYDQVRQQINDGQVPDAAKKEAEDDLRIRGLKARLDELKIERVVQLNKLGENHALVQEITRRIAEIDRSLDQIRAVAIAEARDRMLNGLSEAVMRTQKDLEIVQKRIVDVRAQISALSNDIIRLLTAQDDERVTRELYTQVDNQLNDQKTMTAHQTGAKAFWAARPELPETPSFPKRPVIMALSIFVGLALALGIAFLRELTNTTVRSPRDVARVGQMNLLGMVPDEADDPEAVNTQLPLVIFTAPHSITAEYFRQMRTRLQHAASLDTTRSIMVTGPSPMDGKTTVACNLAAGLALNGRKILLVDANFRRPELHRIFKLANEQGFGDVLNGTIHFDDVAHETQVPNLSVMPSGPKPMNPTELFESQLLIDFIERALEEFDHVIFDSGPFLVVSESAAMAPRVDGVITVVKAHSDSRGLLTRMRDELRKTKAEHLGVVLNAVRAHSGGYYRSSISEYYRYQSPTA